MILRNCTDQFNRMMDRWVTLCLATEGDDLTLTLVHSRLVFANCLHSALNTQSQILRFLWYYTFLSASFKSIAGIMEECVRMIRANDFPFQVGKLVVYGETRVHLLQLVLSLL